MNRIAEHSVRHVFQVTGRGSLFLSDALAKHPDINSISLHHEQACAFAACAYAQANNSLGVCLVSTGCASTNALTGALCAWQDAIPVLFLSGQNILAETTSFTNINLRTYGQQENNIIEIVRPITKYARMITNKSQIFDELDKALFHAFDGRRGPVWLDIPLDLQSSIITQPVTPSSLPVASNYPLKSNDLTHFIGKLSKSSRPLVLIGSGIEASNASLQLKEFSKNNNIPVVYTHSATDTYPSGFPLSIGSVGSMGCSRAGAMAVANCDLLIVIGSRLSSLTTGPDFCKFARDAYKIVVDIDSIEHSKVGIKIDHFILSSAANLLNELSKHELSLDINKWSSKCKHWKFLFEPIEPEFISTDKVDLYHLSRSLSKTLPSESFLITDSGLCEVILPTNISFPEGSRCIHSVSQGAMGYALPASIGVQLSNSSSLVLPVIGDGSIMMNLQELQSISFLQLPIKIIIINNNVYSIIRRRQKELFRKRSVGTDPSNGVSCPDFHSIASSFGFNYLRISTPENLDDQLSNFLQLKGPSICEIMGRDDQSYIEISSARSMTTKRFVRRPIEDQSPFLPRDLFLSEMIVPAIDQ